jgi:hypothetical protein
MKKNVLIPLLLISILLIPSFTVYASYNYSMSFNPSITEYDYGFVNEVEYLNWEIAYSTGTPSSTNFKVYDRNGNLIQEGASGSIKMIDIYYPIKFVADATGDDWRIDIGITYKKPINYTPLIDDLEGLLDSLNSKLQGVLDKLAQLNDYLSNPAPLINATNHLQNSVDDMGNYGPIGVAKETVNTISNIDVNTTDLPKIEIQFIPGQPKINVFDLSYFQTQIGIIRNLLVAILWLGLAIFFIQYITPRFKV